MTFVRGRAMRLTVLAATVALTVTSVAGAAVVAQDEEDGTILAGLVTKTNTNPFFVKMLEGAEQAGEELGIDVQGCWGAFDPDNEGQVECIENLIAAGAEGLLITPADTSAIVPAIQKAREAGMLTIALDTQTDPPDAVDATFATDNYLAGLLIGQWAAAKLGEETANAKIATLDLAESMPSVGRQRQQGFLEGFGVDVKDNDVMYDEDDPRIIGAGNTNGAEDGGRTVMENLLQLDPGINVVYTINEPAAAGAQQALEAAGVAMEDVLLLSVDGGCPGVQLVADGVIDATSMQFPLDMAKLGVEAIKNYAETGEIPAPSEGLDFFNTGVVLITDEPMEGIESQDSTWGLENCWG